MNGKPLNVLLIEDDPDDVLFIKKILSKDAGKTHSARISLQVADQLKAGLSHLENGGTDALLLDLFLPDSSGVETLRAVQNLAPNLPIIILTGLDDEATAIEAVKAGAQDYLVKSQLNWPFLVRAIRYAIERHLIRQALNATNARLEELVHIDPLTELLNRRGLQHVLSQKITRSHLEEADLYALLVDLDDFKKINDNLGHAAGDIVLTEITRKLKGSIRATDYAARIGGDEFMILLLETRLAEAVRVAEKIRLAISGAPVILSSGKAIKATASMGLVPVAQSMFSIDELLMETHQMLANSKRSGKNKVSYEQKEAGNAGAPDDDLSRILDGLRRDNHFKTVKQPIVRLDDRAIVGYEFLSRSTIEGFEMPDDFFRLCSEHNILTLVDHRCFRTCLASAASHPSGARYHMNLLPSTMIDIPIHHILGEFPVPEQDKTYCIEISEQQLIGDPSYLTERVQSIKKAGISVALDDVGYGRSCLESLILLEPDIVKLDKRCIKGIANDPARERSLKRILNVTQSLNTEVIAEGIESEEDLDVLKNLDIKFGQGFLLGNVNSSTKDKV